MIALAKTAKTSKTSKAKTTKTVKAKQPTGYVLYEGPSLLDGSPIVVIALVKSKNTKTGNMVQTYILRSDMSPVEAIRTGADFSICGDCKHRGTPKAKTSKKAKKAKNKNERGRSCYVNIGQGPLIVWKSYVKGNYPKKSPLHPDVQAAIAGRVVRLGTYGDPAALSSMFWRAILRPANGWTGYSHQWTKRIDLQDLVMASCDSVSEFQQATSEGWRTFRVRSEEMPLFDNEVDCPAGEKAGRLTTCDRCKLCQGTSKKARNVSIPAHGGAAVMFNARKLLPTLN